eukprot:m.157477 g.157477  ORF g.157477 m.157477 type:complete len:989 (+) comp15119_c0_seq1:1560-4526(+)
MSPQPPNFSQLWEELLDIITKQVSTMYNSIKDTLSTFFNGTEAKYNELVGQITPIYTTLQSRELRLGNNIDLGSLGILDVQDADGDNDAATGPTLLFPPFVSRRRSNENFKLIGGVYWFGTFSSNIEIELGKDSIFFETGATLYDTLASELTFNYTITSGLNIDGYLVSDAIDFIISGVRSVMVQAINTAKTAIETVFGSSSKPLNRINTMLNDLTFVAQNIHQNELGFLVDAASQRTLMLFQDALAPLIADCSECSEATFAEVYTVLSDKKSLFDMLSAGGSAIFDVSKINIEIPTDTRRGRREITHLTDFSIKLEDLVTNQVSDNNLELTMTSKDDVVNVPSTVANHMLDVSNINNVIQETNTMISKAQSTFDYVVKLEFVQCDLGCIDSVRTLFNKVIAQGQEWLDFIKPIYPSIDVDSLISNAGSAVSTANSAYNSVDNILDHTISPKLNSLSDVTNLKNVLEDWETSLKALRSNLNLRNSLNTALTAVKNAHSKLEPVYKNLYPLPQISEIGMTVRRKTGQNVYIDLKIKLVGGEDARFTVNGYPSRKARNIAQNKTIKFSSIPSNSSSLLRSRRFFGGSLITTVPALHKYTVPVASIEHVFVSPPNGHYFHFFQADAARLLPYSLQTGEYVWIKNHRSGRTGIARFWMYANGGSIGDAHGRFNPTSARRNGDFAVGDRIEFLPYQKRQGFYFEGTTIAVRSASSFEICKTQCEARSECKSFYHNSVNGGVCNMYSTYSPPKSSSSDVSAGLPTPGLQHGTDQEIDEFYTTLLSKLFGTVMDNVASFASDMKANIDLVESRLSTLNTYINTYNTKVKNAVIYATRTCTCSPNPPYRYQNGMCELYGDYLKDATPSCESASSGYTCTPYAEVCFGDTYTRVKRCTHCEDIYFLGQFVREECVTVDCGCYSCYSGDETISPCVCQEVDTRKCSCGSGWKKEGGGTTPVTCVPYTTQSLAPSCPSKSGYTCGALQYSHHCILHHNM